VSAVPDNSEIDDEALKAREERGADLLARIGTPVSSITTLSQQWSEALQAAKDADKDDGSDGWTPLGPRNVGGAVRVLVQDQVVPSTFYAGTSGSGLWRTTDDGNTWEPLGDDTIGIVPICALAVAPSNRNTIYVGTGEAHTGYIGGIGLFRSEDGGATWQKLASGGSNSDGDADHYTRIVVDPVNPRICWVACERGLWRFNNTSATQELNAGDRVDDVALSRDPTDQAKQVVLLVGLRGQGVRRGVYNRDRNSTNWAGLSGLTTSAGGAAANIGRVKVAIGVPNNLNTAYALVHDTVAGFPQPLYASTNGGVSFSQSRPPNPPSAPWPPDVVPGTGIGWYALSLVVHPNQPGWVAAGSVNVHITRDGGQSWTLALDWTKGREFPTRGEHGDVHCLLVDSRDSGAANPRLWVGDDGGVSVNSAWTSPFSWRKRSYGILAAQAVDITSHPVYPTLMGVGMQDNGTFFGYGGPTWYKVLGGDGAALAWHPTNQRQAFGSWQYAQSLVTVSPALGGLHPQTLPDVPPPNNQLTTTDSYVNVVNPALPAPLAGTGVFRALLANDQVTPNRLVVAAVGGAWVSNTGNTSNTFTKLNTGAFTAGAQVGAMAFVPGSVSNNDIYVGTSTGDLFSPGAPPGTWVKRNPFGGAGAWVSSIAVHPLPAKSKVVAAAAYQANPHIVLSHDGGQTWFSLTGSGLPDIPISALAFHPTDERVLYIGTWVGVWVARDLPVYNAASPATSANPTWKTFNRGLGPVPVSDLEVVKGTLTLRVSTFARGAFEASLRGTGASYATYPEFLVPAVKLNIRNHAMDDGRTYTGPAPKGQPLPDDPRLPAGPAPHMSGEHSIDIKVNAPELRDRTAYLQSELFGHSPDGCELDEQFVCENPIAGDTNIAYVQVHNRGYARADNVQVLLYAADAGAGATAPSVNGLSFPGDPAPPWKLLTEQTANVLPGQPRVFRMTFICPLEIKQNVALMAICRCTSDELSPLPSGAAKDWVLAERKAALRILPVVPDRVFIRDGLDDPGQRGSVAWGGRSPDIIVMTKAAADALVAAGHIDDATGPFGNLNDARRGDRVRQGDNTVWVRVQNRGSVPVNGEVRLYNIPPAAISPGTGWTQVGATVVVANIPPRGWKMARIELAAVPADPPTGLPAPWGKAYVLAALVKALNPPDGAVLEDIPDVTTVTGVDEFWTLFNRGPLANNAAFRSLRFQPGGGP
jgi:hypothetical protein